MSTVWLCLARERSKLGPRTDSEDGELYRTHLSHLSLLARQGSQLIALRARFAGGRGSRSTPFVGFLSKSVGSCLGRRCVGVGRGFIGT